MNALLVIVVLIVTTFSSFDTFGSGSINCSFLQPTSVDVASSSSSSSLENSLCSLESGVASSVIVESKRLLNGFVDVVVSPLTLPVAEAARWRKLCPADAQGTSSLFDLGFTLRNNGANDEAVDNDNEEAADDEEEEEVSLCFFFINSINLFLSLSLTRSSSSSSLIERSRSPRR